MDIDDFSDINITRRDLLIVGALSASSVAAPAMADAPPAAPALPPVRSKLALSVNGKAEQLDLDTRTTLLDALREHLHLSGTKKGVRSWPVRRLYRHRRWALWLARAQPASGQGP